MIMTYLSQAYSSILYMKKFTNFKILLRGKPVEQFNIMDDLKYTETIVYRPQLAAASREVPYKLKLFDSQGSLVLM